MLRILIPWRGIGSILTSVSKIFLLKIQHHSFSSLLILVSHKLRKRGIIVPAAAPQKHREQQAASNGRHLLRFGLPSRALAIPFADTRSQDHARQTKLFWGVCENSFKTGKGGREKSQNEDALRYSFQVSRSSLGGRSEELHQLLMLDTRAGAVGHCLPACLPAPARWVCRGTAMAGQARSSQRCFSGKAFPTFG